MKDIKVYAAIDQYRSSIKKELEYTQLKVDAGADGFFTQPFFDIRLMDMYMEYLCDTEVYWGISPVISERSTNYWEIKNNVVFPKSFQHNLEWNIDFAKKVLDFASKTNTNAYFMPIKIDIDNYLAKVFE
jgi:methylenetetrahydrofolate reductase (NADPH)